MTTKPVYPFAEGQVFKNTAYRKFGDREMARWQDMVRSGLMLPQMSKFWMANTTSGLLFSSRNRLSRCVPANVVGYPINPAVTQKLFKFLEPDGYLSPLASNQLMRSICTVPLIKFSVLKTSVSASGGTRKIKAGEYVSVGPESESQNGRNRRSVGLDLLKVAGRGINNSRLPYTVSFWEGFDDTNYDMRNFFLPSCTFTKTGDLFLLPKNSFIWAWHSERWVPCTVFVSKVGADKIKWSVSKISMREGGETEVGDQIICIEGKEISVHRKVAKLISTDAIRVAFRGITNMVPAQSSTAVSPEIARLLVSNYNAPVLDSFKMRLLKSTKYKNCLTFKDFMKEYYESSNNTVLSASYIGTTLASKLVAEYVVRSANDQTPLFWNIRAIDRLENNTKIEDAISRIGFSTSYTQWRTMSGHDLDRWLDHAPGMGEKSHKLFEVDYTIVEKEPMVIVRQRKSVEPLKIEVPEMIMLRGEKAVKRYIDIATNEVIELANKMPKMGGTFTNLKVGEVIYSETIPAKESRPTIALMEVANVSAM